MIAWNASMHIIFLEMRIVSIENMVGRASYMLNSHLMFDCVIYLESYTHRVANSVSILIVVSMGERVRQR